MPAADAPIRSILVLSNRAEEMRGIIEARLPDVAVTYVPSADGLADGLAMADPDAVLVTRFNKPPHPDYNSLLRHSRVRYVLVGGSGYDHMGKWDPAAVTVSNCAGVLAPFLAETVTGAMLALNGNFLRYREQQREKRWQMLAFRPLAGQTLLVVGLGAIGGRVAANARALRMRVLAANRTAKPDPAVEKVVGLDALDAVLPEADVVTLHTRLTPETRHLMSEARIRRMKRGAMLLNTSRGAVVDEAALIAALQDGHIGAAYLDVFETEPLPSSSPLWTMPNVMITPHASDNTADWVPRFTAFFADNVERWNRGEEVVNVVAP